VLWHTQRQTSKLRLTRASVYYAHFHSTVNADIDTDAAHDRPLIEIRDLYFTRGQRQIFNGLTLNIERGKITALMGPSGTGKTTLLKLIGGQLRPAKGTIYVDGQNVHRLRRHALYDLRKRMGMLFQSGALLTDINVFENVAYPLREHTRLPEELMRDVVLMKLEAVGLRGARGLMPSELSGGMARRVALARAIVLDPMMIMYDEPFTGLDPMTKGTIVSLIEQLNQTLGVTSLVVSHDVEETMSIADYAYVIAEGCVVESGTPPALSKSSSAWVQQFIRGHVDGPVPFHYAASDYVHDLLAGDSV
jgi:phospholipid/cholesterol/gamma-HCH transport system ATP-binding protein